MSVNPVIPAPVDELTYCEVHPDRETALRCNKCGRLMCTECAVLTPVGYRCKQCVRQHDDKFFKATSNDDFKVIAICGGAALIGGAIVSAIGLGLLFAIIIGLPLGGAVSELALRATERRRGRRSGEIGAAAVVIGGLAGALIQTYVNYSSMIAEYARQAGGRGELPALSLDFLFRMVLNNWGLLAFVGLIAFAVYGRFKMKM
jgi:hypothetical protein